MVTGELVTREVDGVTVAVAVVAGYLPREPVVGQDQEPGAAVQQPRRDGAADYVAAEVQVPEARERGQGRRDGPGELAVGDDERPQADGAGEEAARDRPGDGGAVDVQVQEAREVGEGGRDGARQARHGVDLEDLERGEVAERRRDSRRDVGEGVERQTRDAARYVAEHGGVPRTAVGGRQPRGEPGRVAQLRLDPQQRGAVRGVAVRGGGRGGVTGREEK